MAFKKSYLTTGYCTVPYRTRTVEMEMEREGRERGSHSDIVCKVAIPGLRCPIAWIADWLGFLKCFSWGFLWWVLERGRNSPLPNPIQYGGWGGSEVRR